MATLPVELPWQMKSEELVLDPYTEEQPDSVHPWTWVRYELATPNTDELERIFRAATILYHKLTRLDLRTDVSYEQCLETAIIWERG